MVRFRKFNGWFTTFGSTKYIKLEMVTKDTSGNKFPLALIIKHENPYFNDIIASFNEIINHYSK
jgi:hypothetical protein